MAGPQPDRKPVRRPTKHLTTLQPGDVLAYGATSGRIHPLAVRAVETNRYGAFPVVRLLDFHQARLPQAEEIVALREQPPLPRAGGGHPAGPWWCVDSKLFHKHRHHFADYGFTIAEHLPAISIAGQEQVQAAVTPASSWKFWQLYLEN